MRFILLVSLLLVIIQGNCQLLQGQWEGVFKDNGIRYPIYLEFILNSDSSYSVYSYSQPDAQRWPYKPNDSSVVCKVFYKFTPPDQVYLEEIEAIQPSTVKQDCFQKMFLKVEKKEEKIMLVGTWKSSSSTCYGVGKISFKKMSSP